MKPFFTVIAAALIGGACSSEPTPEPPQRTKAEQRTVDSTVGASKLPGARGVQGALAASDSMAARNAQLDSAAKAP